MRAVTAAPRLGHGPPRLSLRAPEAAYKWRFYPNALYQATWNMPVTNKLLFEAGFSLTASHYQTLPQPETAGRKGGPSFSY